MSSLDMADNKKVGEGEEKSNEEEEERRYSVPWQPVCPRTLTGPAHLMNKGALEWGANGLLAYGSNTIVMVMDPKTVQMVQSLDHHKAQVKKVLWVPGWSSRKDSNGVSVQLVSGDSSGVIVHWDVVKGQPISHLQDGTKPVLGLQWVPGHEKELMLAALHSPYFLIIWDVTKQSKLWKKSFTDTLLSFAFNPFDSSKLAFLSTDCILFVDDFQLVKIPSSNGRKSYIWSPRVEGSLDEGSRGKDRLKRLMRGLVMGESKPRGDDIMTISECLEMSFHKALRDHLILVYPRDVLIIDLHMSQTVGIIPIDRAMSPLIQVISCKQRDVLYCVHESGTVSAKLRKTGGRPGQGAALNSEGTGEFSTFSGGEMFMCYEGKAGSEPIRQIKGAKVLGAAVDPVTESKLAITLSSGRVVLLELQRSLGPPIDGDSYLSDMVRSSPKEDNDTSLSLTLTALLPALSGSILASKMCPTIGNKSRQSHVPLLALGTSTGTLYIMNLSQGVVWKEFATHAYPIRGLEWTTHFSLISYAFGEGTKVKNQLFLTDIRTGVSTGFRSDRPLENPIYLMRVSPLRQYIIMILVDGPLELWHLPTLTLLRTISGTKKFPLVSTLEWSPILSAKSAQWKSRRQSRSEDADVKEGLNKELLPEYIVCSDKQSQLYHFTVEREGLRSGIKISTDMGMGLVTCIGFKANQIVEADSAGVLSFWDLKARSSQTFNTNRGPIKYFRFAPLKYNMKIVILFQDGLEVVDLKQKQYDKIGNLSTRASAGRIVDVDWASPSHLVVTTDQGWVKIMDLALTTSSSPLTQYSSQEPMWIPALLPPSLLSSLHLLLSTHPMSQTLNFQTSDGFTEPQLAEFNRVVELLELKDDFFELPVIDRCLLLSRLLRDTEGIHLWTLASYYLRASQLIAAKQKEGSLVEQQGAKLVNLTPEIEALDTSFDYLTDSYSYQRNQLERVALHEWKRGDYRHTQKVVERLILLGEMDRAVQLLLETDIDNPNYYTDAIKACLVATIEQTGAAQSTIKLVATNLIANGKVWEGVQLLCLIGKGMDGCRYLLSYGMWEAAVWLAKATLPPSASLPFMAKFAEHLLSSGNEMEALEVYLSLSNWDRVLELLYKHHHLVTAALFIKACQPFGVPLNQDLCFRVCNRLPDQLCFGHSKKDAWWTEITPPG